MDGFLITADVVDMGRFDVPADQLPAEGIDPATFGPGAGTVDVGDLTTTFDAFDLDGDGIVDSRVVAPDNDAAAIIVVSDFDRDGAADRVTMVESDGDFAAWECHRDTHGALVWDRIDSGTV
ncbi:DUF6802 family protein [Rhodococcus sp. 24CO]|uniref:DUF6802 family protein n=1 Tax=Rhodococcus sp. 24CO TaxID=3117460 RepID=UPI003D35952B